MTLFIYITLFGTLSRSTYMFHSTSFNFFLSGLLYIFLFHSTELNIIYVFFFCVNSWGFKLNAYCTFFVAGMRQKTSKT